MGYSLSGSADPGASVDREVKQDCTAACLGRAAGLGVEIQWEVVGLQGSLWPGKSGRVAVEKWKGDEDAPKQSFPFVWLWLPLEVAAKSGPRSAADWGFVGDCFNQVDSLL